MLSGGTTSGSGRSASSQQSLFNHSPTLLHPSSLSSNPPYFATDNPNSSTSLSVAPAPSCREAPTNQRKDKTPAVQEPAVTAPSTDAVVYTKSVPNHTAVERPAAVQPVFSGSFPSAPVNQAEVFQEQANVHTHSVLDPVASEDYLPMLPTVHTSSLYEPSL